MCVQLFILMLSAGAGGQPLLALEKRALGLWLSSVCRAAHGDGSRGRAGSSCPKCCFSDHPWTREPASSPRRSGAEGQGLHSHVIVGSSEMQVSESRALAAPWPVPPSHCLALPNAGTPSAPRHSLMHCSVSVPCLPRAPAEVLRFPIYTTF